MNRLRLTAAFPATACSALATCSSIPRRVRLARPDEPVALADLLDQEVTIIPNR